MNANELADINEWSCCAHSKEVSAMLRQQQTEIEALKKEAALQRLSDFTQEADNEPVAWTNQNTFCKNCHRIPSQCCCPPVKELTSLEIADEMELVFGEQIEEQFGNDLEEFAKAILRKAQEK